MWINRLDELSPGTMTGPEAPPLEGRFPEIEAQAAGRLSRTVAMMATLAEDGLDVLLEIEWCGRLDLAQCRRSQERE